MDESDELPPAPPFVRSRSDSTRGTHQFREYLQLPDQWKAGDRLLQYQLEEPLGQGAVGSVFAAVDQQTGRRVAVKLLAERFARHPNALKRFQKEALMLSRARSSFVTELIAVHTDVPAPFIVTELVDGVSAAELLRERGKLPETTALRIAANIVQALVDIAEFGILHRDIKPANILLTEASEAPDEFVAKLTDFGLARSVEQSQSMELTRDNSVLGTPLYMSPEQFEDAAKLDVRSDIYAVGATLYHLLSGEPPYQASDAVALAEQHRHAPVPSLLARSDSVSDATNEVVRKCLQKRVDLRYSTPLELLNDLVCVLEGKPASIIVHPVTPSSDRRNVCRFRFEWQLSSSAKSLWPFVSDTERLNRAIGLPSVNYRTSTVDDDIQTFAQVRIAGLNMKWREHTFEWIAEQKMGVLREFQSGPLKWFTSVVEFFPTAAGSTRLVHTFQVEPRHLWGRLFAWAKFGVETKRSLTTVYHRIDSVLSRQHSSDPLSDHFEEPPKLSRRQERKLSEVTAQLQEQRISREALLKIAEFIKVAPAQAVGRIVPMRLAYRMNLNFDATIGVLLHGTRAGLMELGWDVICPSCRIASRKYDALRMISEHERCDACNLDFKVDFRNQVEAIFRVHPQIRASDSGTYCIGGPAHSPHVVAQTRVLPMERPVLGLNLRVGSYRIRGPQLPESLEFVVEELRDGAAGRFSMAALSEQFGHSSTSREKSNSTSATGGHLSLDLGDAADWRRRNLILSAGSQSIQLNNPFDREIVVRIERTTARRDVLTAAALIQMPLFQQLFPDQVFTRSQLASISHVTLMQTRSPSLRSLRAQLGDAAYALYREHLFQVSQLGDRHRGTWVKMTDCGGLLAFFGQEDAVKCATHLAETVPRKHDKPLWPVSAIVSTGEVSISTIGGQLDYLGPMIEDLQQQLLDADDGEFLILDGSEVTRLQIPDPVIH